MVGPPVRHEISIRRNRQRAVNWSETWIRGGSALPRRSRKTRCIVLSTLSPISTPDTSLSPLPWPQDAPPRTTPVIFFFESKSGTRRFNLKRMFRINRLPTSTSFLHCTSAASIFENHIILKTTFPSVDSNANSRTDKQGNSSWR